MLPGPSSDRALSDRYFLHGCFSFYFGRRRIATEEARAEGMPDLQPSRFCSSDHPLILIRSDSTVGAARAARFLKRVLRLAFASPRKRASANRAAWAWGPPHASTIIAYVHKSRGVQPGFLPPPG
jgi:hypothetical protein